MERAQGRGIRFYSDNDEGGRLEYAGDFENGLRSGFGIMSFSDGTCYNGEWKCGQPGGCGKEIYPDGSIYIGQFCDDTRQGLGFYYFPDGSVYAGYWSEGQQHGLGIKTSAPEKINTFCTFHKCVGPPISSLHLFAHVHLLTMLSLISATQGMGRVFKRCEGRRIQRIGTRDRPGAGLGSAVMRKSKQFV